MNIAPLCPAAEARVDAIVKKAEIYAHWIGSNQADSMAHEIEAKEDLRAAIRLALKEQDRDTRHACTEHVCGIDPTHLTSGQALTRAQSACMNARAI